MQQSLTKVWDGALGWYYTHCEFLAYLTMATIKLDQN